MTPKEQAQSVCKGPPVIREVLSQLSKGEIIVSFDRVADIGILEEVGPMNMRDIKGQPEFGVPGIGVLYRAGYIDQFGMVTQEGRAFLVATSEVK